MDTNVKKEILLIILNSIFNDKSDEIKSDNCISFYHFFLDILENELFEIPIEYDADISLCNSIIDFLSNFDDIYMGDYFLNYKNVPEYLKDYSGLTDEEYVISISKFRIMYNSIKEDFLLDLI